MGHQEVEVFTRGAKGEDVVVYKSASCLERVGTIPDGTKITILCPESYEGRYHVKEIGYISDRNTGKPLKDKSMNAELNRITANDFIKGGGRTVKFSFAGKEVKCKEYTSVDQLSRSIISGMRNTKGVTNPVMKTFEGWLREKQYGSFTWHAGVTPEEKNKFGVYFGELFVGLMALSGKLNTISPKILKEKAARFLVPDDPIFSGVDSFLEMGDGEIIPISNKYGEGAAASFFVNILPKGIDNLNKLPKCVFSEIAKTATAIGVTSAQLEKRQYAKDVVYEFGVRNVLGIPKSKIKDSYKVYNDIKANKESKERAMVAAAISDYGDKEPQIDEYLDDSTTAFFSRRISDMLNEDKKSIEVMKEILCGKNFYQLNLDMTSWRKGIIKYRAVKSGEASLDIIGRKSAMNDVEAKQGLINYILKVK